MNLETIINEISGGAKDVVVLAQSRTEARNLADSLCNYWRNYAQRGANATHSDTGSVVRGFGIRGNVWTVTISIPN